MKYFLFIMIVNLISLQSHASEGSTFLSCKGGFNNPTWWRLAWIELKKDNGDTSLDMTFDSKGLIVYENETKSANDVIWDNGISGAYLKVNYDLLETGNEYVHERNDTSVGKTGRKIISGGYGGGFIGMVERDEMWVAEDFERIYLNRSTLALRYEYMGADTAHHATTRVSTFKCAVSSREASNLEQQKRVKKSWKNNSRKS